MSVQLVIAEKPSVARSIAGVIGADQKRDGYLSFINANDPLMLLRWVHRQS